MTSPIFDFRSLEDQFRSIAQEAVTLRATFDQPSQPLTAGYVPDPVPTFGGVSSALTGFADCVQTKSNTGDAMLDVVTIADYHLQKLYLELLLKTDLRHCRLLAEESSAELDQMGSQFTGKNGYTLCLDPVDGTQRFVEGSPYYASIVSVRNDQGPVYSWICYPALDWTVSIDSFQAEPIKFSSPPERWAQQVIEDFSQKASLDLEGAKAHLDRQIVYTAGDPQLDCPEKIAPLAERGLAFCKSRDIGPYGAKFLLLAGVTAGYFVARPNPYDGLLAYHFAQAKGLDLDSDLQADTLSNLKSDRRGFHYGFQYLALR